MQDGFCAVGRWSSSVSDNKERPSDKNMDRALQWLSNEPSRDPNRSLFGCALAGPDHFGQESLARLLDQVEADATQGRVKENDYAI